MEALCKSQCFALSLPLNLNFDDDVATGSLIPCGYLNPPLMCCGWVWITWPCGCYLPEGACYPAIKYQEGYAGNWGFTETNDHDTKISFDWVRCCYSQVCQSVYADDCSQANPCQVVERGQYSPLYFILNHEGCLP